VSGRNLSFTEHQSAFVDSQVSLGRHQDASEVSCEARRQHEDALEAERARVDATRAVIMKGRAAIAAGDFPTIASADDADA
jgi:antitoxin ParD1/3/4